MIEIKEPQRFFQLQKIFTHVPFTQSQGWYDYMMQQGNSIVFFVDNENDTNVALWGREQKIPFYGKKIFRIDGECFKSNLSEKKIKDFYSKLATLPYVGIEINSNNRYLIWFEIGLRRAGFVRPIAFFLSPLTIEIDLCNSFNFDRKWRKSVEKATQEELHFAELDEVNQYLLQDIVLMFQEMAELKNLSYRLEEDSLSKLLASPDIRLFVVKNRENKVIAARVVHEHCEYLSDVFAANSLESRNCGATYFLMDNILALFKKEGKKFFDFGRIPPSNHASDSVYVFKNASRGSRVQYNGEWVYYKKRWVEAAIFVYKHFVLKKQRY